MDIDDLYDDWDEENVPEYKYRYSWLYEQEKEYEEKLSELYYHSECDTACGEDISVVSAYLSEIRRNISKLENDQPDSEEYSVNWKKNSRVYRALKGWTCERCGINLDDRKDLLHTHHKDRDKKFSTEYNLEALCVLCHASCDSHQHITNSLSDDDRYYLINGQIQAKKQKHLDMLKTRFYPECYTRNKVFDAIIKKYGAWLEALEFGLIDPMTEGQKHFIDVCKKIQEPKTDFEYAWLAYNKVVSDVNNEIEF